MLPPRVPTIVRTRFFLRYTAHVPVPFRGSGRTLERTTVMITTTPRKDTPARTPFMGPRRGSTHRRSVGALLLIGMALLPLSGCESGWGSQHREVRTMRVPHIAGTALSIENANGSIEALARDRADVSIEFTIYGPDLERLQFANVHADRMGDQTLRVWVEWPGGKRERNEGAAISINTPQAEGVNIRSSNGSITIAGLSGHAELKSSNGSVRIDTHDGSVHAVTTNGSLSAERVSGPIELFSTNGRVMITDAFGPILAETTNGNAYVSTTPGNTGLIRIRTSNGRVDLDLGEGFEGILKCDTTNGKVQVSNLEQARLIESSNRSVELRVGNSDEISAVRTSNGSVRVRGR